MTDHAWLAHEFETHRNHLHAVAWRMLGSESDADDAVQETWLRVSRAGADGVENLGGWLTRITARVCLDQLRSRSAARSAPLLDHESLLIARDTPGSDPEAEAVQADAVGLAVLVVLEMLSPAERIAFVLHDMFGEPFEEIGQVLGKSPVAARQLASRARRRVRGAEDAVAGDVSARRREIVTAFLAAARAGDFATLVALLDPAAIARPDAAAAAMGGLPETRGAEAVAGVFSGSAKVARLALINGEPGLVWATRKQPTVIFTFAFDGDAISEIVWRADPEFLAAAEVVWVNGPARDNPLPPENRDRPGVADNAADD